VVFLPLFLIFVIFCLAFFFKTLIISKAPYNYVRRRSYEQGRSTFKVDRRKARKGRHPRTGEPIKIKAKKVPKFVASSVLKDEVA